MKLIQLLEFAQMYHDMGIDFQLQLDSLLTGKEHNFSYDILSSIKEWLVTTATEINNEELTKDIASVIDDMHTQIGKCYHDKLYC
jgi:hypothetical protein